MLLVKDKEDIVKSGCMIGVDPTQWKKRWESIIREDNAIICTCLWATLGSMIKVLCMKTPQTNQTTVPLNPSILSPSRSVTRLDGELGAYRGGLH